MKLSFNPIKVLGKTLLVVGLTLALGGASLFAQTIYTGTLANLAATGGSLSIGDKTFSGFRYQDSGLTAFDPTAITVTASESGGVDYLTWSGTISLVSGGVATADLLLNYIVTANPGKINMIDQAYTLGSVNNGSLAVDETVSTSAGGVPIVASSHLDINTPSQTQGPTLNVNPAQSVLYVTKDISFAVIPPVGAAGNVTITQVEQSFHQVPEPGTMLLGSLGGGLLLLLNSRRRVKRD
jgi:hypothetical protein